MNQRQQQQYQMFLAYDAELAENYKNLVEQPEYFQVAPISAPRHGGKRKKQRKQQQSFYGSENGFHRVLQG